MIGDWRQGLAQVAPARVAGGRALKPFRSTVEG